jgi:hypothetical protein
MLVELAKLEINIGTINENEISENLARRISESLENAIQNKISIVRNSISGYDSFGQQLSDKFLIDSIEIFIQNGYFPFGLEESMTFDDLVRHAIEQNRKIFTSIIEKYSREEHAAKRIIYNVTSETFDLILFTLTPENHQWIIDFRKIVTNAAKDNNLSQFTNDEFQRETNYFTLKYLIQETGIAFDKQKFSTYILKEFLLISSNIRLLSEAVKKYTGNTTSIISDNDTIAKRNPKNGKEKSKDKNPDFDIFSLIELLNRGNGESKFTNRQLLKDEIIHAILDQKKRNLLIKQLNKTAINFILELFEVNDSKVLINLIISFTENVAGKNIVAVSAQEKFSVNKLVIHTVIYLNENSFRILDQEEYILFLIYSSSLNSDKIAKSDDFTVFLKAQKNIDIKKVLSLIDEEKQYPEISGIEKLISKRLKQAKTKENDLYPEAVISDEYYLIYSRKIIGYYLDYGQLPSAYFDLNWRDVQTIFRDLIQQNDDFLATQIRNNQDPENLIRRIKSLTINLSDDDLKDYLTRFFKEEYTTISKILAVVKLHFTFKSDSRIHSRLFQNQLFITTLAKSYGGNSSGIFILTLLESLNNEIAEDSGNSPKLLQYLFSKSEDIPEIEALKIKLSPDAEFKKAIARDVKLHADRLLLNVFDPLPSSDKIKKLIKNLSLYFHADQKAFLEILQENRTNLIQIYTLLKFYIPQNEWDPIEESLLSAIRLKKEIEVFQKHSDIIIEKIKQPDLNLIQTFESISPSEPQKLKSFLLLIISDEVLFKKFISQSKNDQLPTNFDFGNKRIRTYLQQLITFSPESLSARLDQKFWKSVVLSFGIRVFLENEKFEISVIAEKFINHLLQKLKVINEVDLFYPILERMKTSGSKELQELAERRYSSKDINTGKTSKDESDYRNSSKEIQHYITILKFYVQNGFFPWWAENHSFPELISELNRSRQLLPNKFEEIFLHLEKEEQLFEGLLQKLPDSEVHEFEQLISSHSQLKLIWKNIRRKDKTIDIKTSNLVFKELYIMGDDMIMNQWLKHDHQITDQIREYLLLSPYFYFRNVNPAQWRQTVYEFALDFYSPEKTKVSNQFHSEFLKYLQSKYTNIKWTDTLTAVYQRNKSTFPKEMIEIIKTENVNQIKNKETENDTNTNLSTDFEGIEVKVYNAGLILFWPFLTRLFEHLSLVKNGAFINQECMNRAVYILQYLAYFAIDFPEYKLALNKLLVGMQSHDHLDPFITLTNDEKESANSLLKGLINNWEKVKNSSPEGIQETFLKREGLLRFQTEKVTLIVEKKGVDILVESIPWNISLIKLAWMKMPIYVEWI